MIRWWQWWWRLAVRPESPLHLHYNYTCWKAKKKHKQLFHVNSLQLLKANGWVIWPRWYCSVRDFLRDPCRSVFIVVHSLHSISSLYHIVPLVKIIWIHYEYVVHSNSISMHSNSSIFLTYSFNFKVLFFFHSLVCFNLNGEVFFRKRACPNERIPKKMLFDNFNWFATMEVKQIIFLSRVAPRKKVLILYARSWYDAFALWWCIQNWINSTKNLSCFWCIFSKKNVHILARCKVMKSVRDLIFLFFKKVFAVAICCARWTKCPLWLCAIHTFNNKHVFILALISVSFYC